MSWSVTDHALVRFQERVRALDRRRARDEMRRMLPLATASRLPPEWLDRDPEEGMHWRIYGDVAFLIRGGNIVITVYVRGGLSEGEAQKRRRKRRGRRHAGRRMPRPRSERRRLRAAMTPDLEEH